MMSIFIWAVLGLSIGFIANKLINHQGGDSSLNMILGMTGAIDGGFMVNFLGIESVAGYSVYTMLVSALVAAALILVCNVLIFGGSLGKHMKRNEQGRS
jgi:uncharacterized membrane protein YeaQ/YmgE (transglycosylase-associated protein family)